MRNLILGLFFICSCIPLVGQAQRISILETRVEGDTLVLSYNLEDAPRSQAYFIQIYALRGNDTLLLREVTGAVGDSIRSGTHEIVWLARKEWQRFRGKVTFYIKATPYFQITKPLNDTIIKRGVTFSVQWYGSNSQDKDLVIELYRYGAMLDTLAQVSNVTGFTWLVPDKIDPGPGYRFRVSDPSDPGIDKYSAAFTIHHKTPPITYIGPAAAVAGGLIWLLLRKPIEEAPDPFK